jgi:bacterioferritin-associated ferredoxin
MYVCICNGVTDRDIRNAADAGCRSMPELTMRTGAGSTCGSCIEMATAILDEAIAARAKALPLPVLSVAA